MSPKSKTGDDTSAKDDDIESAQAQDEWLDEVLKETFPASDPMPFPHKDVPQPR